MCSKFESCVFRCYMTSQTRRHRTLVSRDTLSCSELLHCRLCSDSVCYFGCSQSWEDSSDITKQCDYLRIPILLKLRHFSIDRKSVHKSTQILSSHGNRRPCYVSQVGDWIQGRLEVSLISASIREILPEKSVLGKDPQEDVAGLVILEGNAWK